MKLVRLSSGGAVKERRLRELLAGREETDPRVRSGVHDAQLRGSLELAGLPPPPSEAADRLAEAMRTTAAARPLDLDMLLAWHRAAVAGGGALRDGDLPRTQGPPAAPPALLPERLRTLLDWLQVESARELAPAAAGALALARLTEIAPFPTGNGLVARLATSHVMERAGARPPILTGADAPRLDAAMQEAFQLQTEALTALLEEAAERSIDVMLRALGDYPSRDG